jgi:exodeoxyribonuclease VII large subunit
MKWLSPKTKVYSVDEITTYIKNLLEEDRVLQEIRVKGEITNFIHHNRKHMYFDLKDEHSIIRCAMFWNSNNKLDFVPEDGIEVIVKGHVDVYKKKGYYELIVEEMQLAGKGALYAKFLKLKEKLEKEGLFKEKFKKPIPKIPGKIGIIASLEGAAVKDIIKTIRRRFPHVNLIIYPSLVQGNEAKYQIGRGIEVLNKLRVDVIILARGGGSFEDLWPFNEENVARAIFKSKIPIITGIGHEIDFTISDFVTDKRAPTPSVAAELAVPNIIEIKNLFLSLEKILYNNLIRIRESYKQRITYIRSRPFFRRPSILIEQDIQMIDDEREYIIKVFMDKNKLLKKEFVIFEEKLKALSPRSTLRRGFSITMRGSKVIKSIKDIKTKDIISTIVSDGKIKSKVE